ncbi:molybdopterin-guanine dinucleotide biosynthesis protein B [Salinicola aestuarinus]|uniref:molybdopterin-guanine dinucleotide biosynthesis protein B n=1 Tax=Salinicola aestuarinus TaxID=1949082 RepID=UPI000DA2663A|nr:molybdopterin-guanine dinucleotide biosynthesis protein B [Salinicola aestuarinus]
MQRPATAAPVIPVLGIVAWSGTGKTTLLEKLLPRLGALGWPAAVIKHAHHAFDVDTPGKDSYRLRAAGAAPTLVASGRRFALMMETPGQEEPDLGTLISQVAALGPALILVEGFKSWPVAKLELRRGGASDDVAPHRELAKNDPWIRAVAMKPLTPMAGVASLDLDDPGAIADWIAAWAAAFDPDRDLDASLIHAARRR